MYFIRCTGACQRIPRLLGKPPPMLLGAVFEREVAFVPRARGLYVARAVYAGSLLEIGRAHV